MSALEGLAAVVISTVLAVGVTLFVRKRVSPAVLRSSHDVAAAILGVVGTVYAVLLAFTVIIVWEHYSDASSAVEKESNDLADLARLAAMFDNSDRDAVDRALFTYARSAINEEWPAMARGHSDPRTWRAVDRVWATYRGVAPRNGPQQIALGESIRRLDEMSDSRRVRLHALDSDVPPLMWMLLILGAVVVIAFCLLFAPESRKVHATMVGLLTALIAANLYLAYDLDNPFDGWPQIDSGVIQQQLERSIQIAHEPPPR